MNITFSEVTIDHQDLIFNWLAEPHIMESWDNTQAHKDDILNFIHGRKTPSPYCDGKYVYWIAKLDNVPFAMLMTIQETIDDNLDSPKLKYLSSTGHTYGIDYMIGNKNYFGKGYGARTLAEFIDYLRENFDKKADTFIIDPATDNPKAKHVYEKAGFAHVADFIMSGDVSGFGKPHHLLVKSFSAKVTLL